MPVLSTWEHIELSALHPDFVAKLLRGWDACERQGLRLALRKFGGLRTLAIQTQLKQWRDEADAKDGIIGGGRDYYRVAAPGTSHHEYGAAVDLMPADPAKRTNEGYRLMADTMQRHGLRAGYYFSSPRDEFHIQDDISLSAARVRWEAYVKTRAKFWGSLASFVLIFIVVAFIFSPTGRL